MQTQDQALQQNELLVLSLVDALQRADTAAIIEMFWPEATYDDYASQLQHRGIEEILGYVTSVHAWADDVYMNVGEVHASASGAVAEWLFAAVQARPMGDLVPEATGLEVQTNGVTIIEVDGGRIRRAADYMDTAPMFLQLGGRIELPGGGVMELDAPR
jgi:ketosteroid isomerase-like protein